MTEPADASVLWGVMIPLRDGVRLHANIYLPKVERNRVACVLIMTPYIADSHHARGMYFASCGLGCMVVDVRGRGDSEGTFKPNIQEANDGFDVVEWLASRDFCNGKVAMSGGSYLGYAQWATAKEFPPHLVAIAPAAAPFLGVDFPMRNNMFHPWVVQWLFYVSGRVSRPQCFSDREFWGKLYRTWYESGRSLRDLESLLGKSLPVFQEWLDHPQLDEYWDAYNPTPEQYAKLSLPILTITGAYDDEQPGALEHYRQHLLYAPEASRTRHYLIIGPWDHLGTGWNPQESFGGIRVGRASCVDMQKLHVDWYRWSMEGGPRPEFLRKSVAYYVVGAERWRYADSLDAITARYTTLFLDSTARAKGIFSSGTLGPDIGRGDPDSYTYDPRVTGSPEVSALMRADGGSYIDQGIALALGEKLLVYHSDPLPEDVEISGFFKLQAWISIDCPDTDLFASIYEIGLDGACVCLGTDAIRARYREGLRTPRLIETREALLYEFKRFTFTSRLVRKGCRLRLIVAPVGKLIDAIFIEKNYNGGGVVAAETANDGRAVSVRLFHDEEHPSALYIPIAEADEEEKVV